MALVVITGGARSGKSGAAQRLALSRLADGQRVMVAVFGSASDGEMADRIARHRADRPAGLETLEATSSREWFADVPDGALLVVDCLGTCFGRALLEAWDESVTAGTEMTDAAQLPPGFEAATTIRTSAVVEGLLARTGDTIVVTNEVGDGLVPDYATGRLFRDELGRANRILTDRADAAYLAVAGRLLNLTELPRDAHWPHD